MERDEFEPFVSVEDGASQAGTDALVAELIRRLEAHPEKFVKSDLVHLDKLIDDEMHKRSEKELAIDEMKDCCPHHGSWDAVGRIYAEALYDAGYRKQK